uniref:Uncharacterized protein n=1 Tax=Dulem virus 40 TaxID=3145758 RepID=A0AAU8AWB8_9CAUD
MPSKRQERTHRNALPRLLFCNTLKFKIRKG